MIMDMGKPVRRRDFIKTAAAGTITLGFASKSLSMSSFLSQQSGRIGIIGLDTSHSVAFTRTINDPNAGPDFAGYKIVAAYPREVMTSNQASTGFQGILRMLKAGS